MLVMLAAAGPNASRAQVFSNASDAYNIAQYNWDGHYGAGLTLADWDNDGWRHKRGHSHMEELGWDRV